MRNSNKVLLIAAAFVLAFVVAFVLIMGLAARGLFEQQGRTVRLEGYRFIPSSTMVRSCDSTSLAGSCSRASSSTARASS